MIQEYGCVSARKAVRLTVVLSAILSELLRTVEPQSKSWVP